MRRLFIFLLLADLLILAILAWGPWLNDEEIHDRVLAERGHRDGTYGYVVYGNGTVKYELICDYNVHWIPFGRWVASCEGAYFVTFWNQIIP